MTRIGIAAATMIAAWLTVACGSEGSVQGPPASGDEPAPPTLDFTSIAGDWEGVMTTPTGFRSFMEITLGSRAQKGANIGTVVYDDWNCVMTLLAGEAEPPAYALDEKYVSGPTGCAEGVASLEHDPAAGALQYTFVNHDDENDTGTATLTRP